MGGRFLIDARTGRFIKAINQVKDQDQIFEFRYKRQDYQIRVLKLVSDSGDEEILITSFILDYFTIDDFRYYLATLGK